jgi:hypothetical protein
MLKLLREWGFPAGLGTLWVIALIYTLNSVSTLPMGQRRSGKGAPAKVADPFHRS